MNNKYHHQKITYHFKKLLPRKICPEKHPSLSSTNLFDNRETVNSVGKHSDCCHQHCFKTDDGLRRCVQLTPDTDQLKRDKHFDRLIPNSDHIEIVRHKNLLETNTEHVEADKLYAYLTPKIKQLEMVNLYNRLTPNTDQLEAGDMQRNTNASGMSPSPKAMGTQKNVNPQSSQPPPGQYMFIPLNTQNISPAYFQYQDTASPRGFTPQITQVTIMPKERLGFPYDSLSELSPEALIVLCIICCFVFFFPTGLAAVIFAILALMAHKEGNMQQARSYSLLAQKLIVISVVITAILIVISMLMIIFMFIFIAGSGQNVNRQNSTNTKQI